jgi:adenylate kinase
MAINKKLSTKLSRELRALMVELGRKGGKKSAKARMTKIPPEKRREIARNAALSRWKKKRT